MARKPTAISNNFVLCEYAIGWGVGTNEII